MLLLGIKDKNGKDVEQTEISWNRICYEKIIPKREPDEIEGEDQIWKLSFENRLLFCSHANKMIEKYGASIERLYGFFGVEGFKLRWIKNEGVDWFLRLKDQQKGLKNGQGNVEADGK